MNRFNECCVSGPVEVEMFEITTNPDPEEPIATTIICKTCGQEFRGDMRPAEDD